MAVKELTTPQITALVDTRAPKSQLLFAARGLQPYYDWLVRTLYQLDSVSAGDFRVWASDVAMTVIVSAGRCDIGGVALAYAGGTVDLTAYNNDTAYVWLYNNAGTATIGSAADGTGWPAAPGSHIKLAEVTLSGGAITAVLDRRMEALFRVTALIDAIAALTPTDGNVIVGNGTTWVAESGATARTSLGAAASGVNADITQFTALTTPTTAANAATKAYVDAVAQGLDWQDSILDRDLTTPPGSPATGARYIVATSGTGAWSGHNGDIAEWDGSAWVFTDPNEGFALRVEDENLQIVYNGSAWVGLGTGVSLDDVQDGATYKKLAGVDGSHQATAASIAGGAIETSHLAEPLAGEFVTYEFSLDVQGDTATPSEITIYLTDAQGNYLFGAENLLRVRVCDEDGWAVATNATIAAGADTSVVETLSAGKDLIFADDEDAGVIAIDLTNATAETVTLRIGPAPLSARRGDYTPTLDVTHAAP